MYKIALCDDDSSFLEELQQHISTYFSNGDEPAMINFFSDAHSLTTSVSSGERFDLFFLDVEMPAMNGFEAAQKIRAFQPNAIVLFLTSHVELAGEGYKVEALRYMSKLKLESALPEALEHALQKISHTDAQALLVQHYNNFTRILHQDILYVQKSYRNTQIITRTQGIVKDNRGLKELHALIHDPHFIFTDRSYFINLDYAQQLEGTCIVMRNGDRLPVSRPMLPHVKEAILALWGNGR